MDSSCPACKEVFPRGGENSCAKCGWSTSPEIYQIDYPDDGLGIFSYIVGYKYPYKGWGDARTVDNVAVFKRAVIATVKALTELPKAVWFPRRLAFVGLRWFASIANAASANVNKPADRRMWEPYRFCRMCRELLEKMKVLLDGLTPEEEVVVRDCVLGLMMILEFDNAYRFRVQDLLWALDKPALVANPRKETLRLLDLGIARERITKGNDVRKKFVLAKQVLGVLFLWPSFRRVVTKTLLALDLEEVRLDQADRYFTNERWDYDFGGLSYEERLKSKVEEDKDFVPPPRPRAELTGANIGVIPNDAFWNLSEDKALETFEKMKSNFFLEFTRRKTMQEPVEVKSRP